MIQEQINSKRHAKVLVATGVAFAILYKVYKHALREWIGLDPSQDYMVYELSNTGFRFLNSVIGIVVCYWAYNSLGKLLKSESKPAKLWLTGYLVSFAVVKLLLLQLMPTPANHFIPELLINGLTGVSEEFIFRAMMTGGLWYLFGFWKAAIGTAVFFSAWHYDVVKEPIYFVQLALASMVYSVAFAHRAGLVSLILIHFLWDQVHFGLYWNGVQGNGYKLAMFVVEIGFLWALIRSGISKRLIPALSGR